MMTRWSNSYVAVFVAGISCLLVAGHAGANEFPRRCNGAVMVAALGSVMKSCPGLRVTTAAALFTAKISREPSYQGCLDIAKATVLKSMMLTMISAGDEKTGQRIWCDEQFILFDGMRAETGVELVQRR